MTGMVYGESDQGKQAGGQSTTPLVLIAPQLVLSPLRFSFALHQQGAASQLG